MRLVFLGTSSGTPTRERNVSGLAVRFDDGGVWIVDCGEGTQHRLLETGIRPGRIERILLTHLHGDHCYGLPGLIANIAIHDRTDPVEVIGPPGTRELVDCVMRVCDQRLGYPLAVSELGGAGEVGRYGRWRVDALPLVHRLPSFAFLLREDERRGRLDAERARALGVPDGPVLGRLAAGETVTLPGGATVRPDQVLGPPRPGRFAVLCGDSADSSSLIGAADGCDVLVHECTFEAARGEHAVRWGHSTTAMVADLARAVRPKLLLLTHFSSRYTTAGGTLTVADLVREVEERAPGQRVMPAHDFLEVAVEAEG